MKTNAFQNKVRIFFCFIVLFAFLMVVRLYFLQIVYGKNYTEKANTQYTNISVDTYDRGNIFFQDKDGNLLTAAGLKTGYILAINPKLMATDTDEYYNKISAIITIDESDFYSKASKVNQSYEVIAQQVSEDDIKKIDDLNLTGTYNQSRKLEILSRKQFGFKCCRFCWI